MGHGEEVIARNVPYINSVFVFFEEVTFNRHPQGACRPFRLLHLNFVARQITKARDTCYRNRYNKSTPFSAADFSFRVCLECKFLAPKINVTEILDK